MNVSHLVSVADGSAVGEARRAALTLATRIGLGSIACDRLQLVATEIATNLAVHASQGELVVRPIRSPENVAVAGVEILAIDRGPGILDAAEAFRDGWSTAGTLGAGLSSIRRHADFFDVYTERSKGTVALARIYDVDPGESRGSPTASAIGRAGFHEGAVSVAKKGEEECGDAWALDAKSDGARACVIDGLGHGPDAARAAQVAIRAFFASSDSLVSESIRRIHDALRSTRGAAGAVAQVDATRAVVRYCGVGNIGAFVGPLDRSRHMVSSNGILGHGEIRPQQFDYPWEADALMVMHSDGLSSKLHLGGYVGLDRRHPGIVAGLLFRDFGRGTDDATVVVMKVLPP